MHNPVPLSVLPDELQKAMDRIGPLWQADIRKYRDAIWDAFVPLLRAAPKDGVVVTRDIPYGSHPRQVLDVHRPANRPDAPIVVFMHGGAFVRGDKSVNDEGYGNLLTWFARQGYVGLNVEYRLAPEAVYPAGADDLEAVIAWIRRSRHDHGGNPDRIFLIGHSAGGTHVATYAFDPEAGHLGRGVAGVVLISARLRADVSPENPNADGVRAYFGADEATYDARSPVTYAGTGLMPTFVAIAEFENPLLDVYGAEFVYRRSAALRRAIPFIRMARHNHISIVAHFNTADEILGREIVRFFESVP
jgi:acetyl esterase